MEALESKVISFLLWIVLLVIVLHGICVEGGKKSAESVIVINTGGGC